jgi:hypothetical protein
MVSVCGLGDPVLDIVTKVPHELLKTLHAEPGGCITVDQEEMVRLLSLPEVQQNSLRFVTCLHLGALEQGLVSRAKPKQGNIVEAAAAAGGGWLNPGNPQATRKPIAPNTVAAWLQDTRWQCS